MIRKFKTCYRCRKLLPTHAFRKRAMCPTRLQAKCRHCEPQRVFRVSASSKVETQELQRFWDDIRTGGLGLGPLYARNVPTSGLEIHREFI